MAAFGQQPFQAYNPNQAQPVQPQSQGTPYGKQADYSAYNQHQQSMQGGGNFYNTGMSPQQYQQSMSAWAMPKQDLKQWAQGLQPQQPIQPRQATSPYGTYQSQNINDINQQRSAMIQQINDAQAKQQVGTWLGQGEPDANWGKMNINPQQMWQNANQMVQNGWTNPFMPNTSQFDSILNSIGQQAPPTQYGPSPFLQPPPELSAPVQSLINQGPGGQDPRRLTPTMRPAEGWGQRATPWLQPVQQPAQPAPKPNLTSSISDLFSGAGIKAPAGFIDQLIALLGGQSGQKPPAVQPPTPDTPATLEDMKFPPGRTPGDPLPTIRPVGPGDVIAMPPGRTPGDPLPTPPQGYYWDENRNLKYSGKYDPRKYYDDSGREAHLPIIEFVSETPAAVRQKAYDDEAAKLGFYKRDESGKRIGATPTSPPGTAQPIPKPADGREGSTHSYKGKPTIRSIENDSFYGMYGDRYFGWLGDRPDSEAAQREYFKSIAPTGVFASTAAIGEEDGKSRMPPRSGDAHTMAVGEEYWYSRMPPRSGDAHTMREGEETWYSRMPPRSMAY